MVRLKLELCNSACAKRLASHLSAEALLLQIKETGCPLDIRQGLGPGLLQPFKDLPVGQRPFKLPDELFQMVRDHSVEILAGVFG